jgi:hypothetical protein
MYYSISLFKRFIDLLFLLTIYLKLHTSKYLIYVVTIALSCKVIILLQTCKCAAQNTSADHRRELLDYIMLSLHSVHKMNAYTADHVCLLM